MQNDTWIKIIAWLVSLGVPMTPLAGTWIGYLLLSVALGIAAWRILIGVNQQNPQQRTTKFLLLTPTVMLFIMGTVWSYYAGLPALISKSSNPVSVQWEPNKRETISRKTFINETVEIDGKIFDRCTFKNVRLLFHGSGPVGFIESKFSGSVMFESDNPAINEFTMLHSNFHSSPNITNHFMGEKDADGNIRMLPDHKNHGTVDQKNSLDSASEKKN